MIIIACTLISIASLYDIYVNYRVKKAYDQSIKINKELERKVREINLQKNSNVNIDGKELIKVINEAQRKTNSIIKV